MTAILRHDQCLSEDQLRNTSRSVRTIVPARTTTGRLSPDQLKDLSTLYEDVFATCSSSGLKATHRVAAWNLLCSLIDQSLDSGLAELNELIWRGEIWTRAFDLYLSHAQSARPRSSRQLLVTLTNGLRKEVTPNSAQVKQQTVERLVGCLADYESPHAAKAGAQLLGSLLTKDVVALRDVISSFGEYGVEKDITNQSYSEHDLRFEQLLETVLLWLGKADFSSTVAQLLSILLDKADTLSAFTSNPVWSRPLQHALQGDTVDVDSLRAHILPVLFKRNFGDFVTFLQDLGLNTLGSCSEVEDTASYTVKEALLFAALQTGKEMGLISETNVANISHTSTGVQIPLSVVGKMLKKDTRGARVTALSLLITSPSPTTPLSATALRLIKKCIGTMFADVDADFRSNVFSAFQKLVDRMRAITAALGRQNSVPNGVQATSAASTKLSTQTFAKHREFLEWTLRFLAWELRPTASYQRHISSLKCLSTLVRSGLDPSVPEKYYSKSAVGSTKWPFNICIMSPGLQRLLLDLVLDPFDDVRQNASTVLHFIPWQEGICNQNSLSLSLERAEVAMLSSGRADQADGVAHIYALCFRRCDENAHHTDDFWLSNIAIVGHMMTKLEQTINIARKSLAEAVEKYPVHGLLTSLRYVLNQGLPGDQQQVQHRLFVHLTEIWDIVKPVLCNDAPEGYLPDELEDSPESSKETLSYCWRALKEASLLLSTLIGVQQLSVASTHSHMLQEMSELCFTQLAELRHRGAFSTVAQTWTLCCMSCKDIRSSGNVSILEQWYGQVLDLLRNNVTINTRRSAGLPSLLCGILIADQTGKLLTQAFEDLEDIARQKVDLNSAEDGSLSHVHAMNCLKDILKNTRLGEQSERYVPPALKLAADALQSEIWAIRNCGLMLFRALIDRLLGTDQSYFEDTVSIQKYISAEEYPELLDVILGLLPRVDSAASVRYEGVFPALQLLQHTRLPAARFEQVVSAVHALIGCPLWHVRDKAARTMAALLIQKWELRRAQNCLDALKQDSPQVRLNVLHGASLVIKYLFVGLRRVAEKYQTTHDPHGISPLSESWVAVSIGFLRLHFRGCFEPSSCFVTHAARLDVVREVFNVLAIVLAPDQLRKEHNRLLADWHQANGDQQRDVEAQDICLLFRRLLPVSSQVPGAAILRQAAARFLVQQVLYANILTLQDVSSYTDLLMDVARQDEDACGYLLAALGLANLDLAASTGEVVYGLVYEILESDMGVTLKCEAQRVLLGLLSIHSSSSLLPLADYQQPLQLLELDNSNQRFADQNLQLQAVQLDRKVADLAILDNTSSQETIMWSRSCTDAVDGVGIHTREASVQALGRVKSLWRILSSHPVLNPSFQKLCVAVYDLLSDDDEDIRLLAAKITQKVLKTADATADCYEPIIASQKLLGFCLARWAESSSWGTIAIHRAFDVSLSVAEHFATLTRNDSTLFAEEKQNLYIDDAKEARAWSQVVQRLSPGAVPRPLIAKLGRWAMEGLDTLVHQAETMKDGPLGWSSKADIFTLGLKLIYCVETLLVLARNGARLSVQPSHLRRKLFECETALRSSEVNCLWLREVERVLADSVMQKVVMVYRLLYTVNPTMA